jgi:hypothetical protein
LKYDCVGSLQEARRHFLGFICGRETMRDAISLDVTPAARAAILAQFALMERREPGLLIHRQPGS